MSHGPPVAKSGSGEERLPFFVYSASSFIPLSCPLFLPHLTPALLCFPFLYCCLSTSLRPSLKACQGTLNKRTLAAPSTHTQAIICMCTGQLLLQWQAQSGLYVHKSTWRYVFGVMHLSMCAYVCLIKDSVVVATGQAGVCPLKCLSFSV